jgi:hypothetical protein
MGRELKPVQRKTKGDCLHPGDPIASATAEPPESWAFPEPYPGRDIAAMKVVDLSGNDTMPLVQVAVG